MDLRLGLALVLYGFFGMVPFSLMSLSLVRKEACSRCVAILKIDLSATTLTVTLKHLIISSHCMSAYRIGCQKDLMHLFVVIGCKRSSRSFRSLIGHSVALLAPSRLRLTVQSHLALLSQHCFARVTSHQQISQLYVHTDWDCIRNTICAAFKLVLWR